MHNKSDSGKFFKNPIIMKLLDAVDTNTVGVGYHGNGCQYNLTVFADSFGGGTVSIEISDNGGTHWVPVTFLGAALTFTASSSRTITKLSQGQLIRASLSGATGASNVSAILTQ